MIRFIKFLYLFNFLICKNIIILTPKQIFLIPNSSFKVHQKEYEGIPIKHERVQKDYERLLKMLRNTRDYKKIVKRTARYKIYQKNIKKNYE